MPLHCEKENAKQIPRIQNEKVDAMNISVPSLNMRQSLSLFQPIFMCEVVGLNPASSSL